LSLAYGVFLGRNRHRADRVRTPPRPGAAGYVNRILKGAKPAELAAQAPTKFEMVIDIKTAKTLGIAVALRYLPAQTR
jgi:putative tryptophan/tyrosine transport system substrate-binding protein